MKVLLTLMALCITLGLCHGFCYFVENTPAFIDGQVITPDGCTDIYDKTKHAFGDIWNSAHCMRCSCGRKDMQCCARYGGIARVEGCTGIIDPETCKHKFYKIDDPTTLCAFQLP